MKLEGKVVLVVGGGSGIGKSISEVCLCKGAKVCIADINEEVGNQTTTDLKQEHGESVVFNKCDVQKEADVMRAFHQAKDEFGKRVEVSILTAGVVNENNWELCVDINVGGAIRFMNSALNHMGKDKGGLGGTIVLSSSISGIQPEKWGPVYCATKHAIIGLARGWAEPENYKIHGVRINCACPSATDTPFLKQVIEARHVEWHVNRLKTANIFSAEETASIYLKLIEDDTLNGQAIRLTRDKGNELIRFPDAVYV